MFQSSSLLPLARVMFWALVLVCLAAKVGYIIGQHYAPHMPVF